MSAEQSQQSLAGPGKQKDFAKPPEASGGSENPTTNQEDNDTDKRTVPLASHIEGVKEMTVAGTQRIMDIVKDLPDEMEGIVINFVVNLKQEPEKTNRTVNNMVRIGVSKGKYKAPYDFDANNEEVYAMIMESASKL